MPNLVSTAPYVLQALLSLAQAAGAAQSPKVQVFPFEPATNIPQAYAVVSGFEHHNWQWETIGFNQVETYDIHGLATVFTGGSQVDQTIATDVMFSTYSLFQNVVMIPVMSNLVAPVLGNTGPIPGAVNQVYPIRELYKADVSEIGGWYGELDWAFRFVAYVQPT